MECNKEEAIRAKNLAEKKMQNNDFIGAQKIALKAQQLFPDIENISQMLTVCDVHCSARAKVNGEMDWYGILQVELKADDTSIKKQYRKLALLLHPDKNQFAGAEAAFKLIVEAYDVLSDRAKRSLYDVKRNSNIKNVPSRQSSHYSRTNAHAQNNFSTANFNRPNQQATQTFWTICPVCGIRYQYYLSILNRSLRCQNCLNSFTACDLNAKVVPSVGNPCNRNGNLGKQIPVQQVHNINQQTQFGKASSDMGFQGDAGGRSGFNRDNVSDTSNMRKQNQVDATFGEVNEVKLDRTNVAEVCKGGQAAKVATTDARKKMGSNVVLESSDSDSSDSEDVAIMEDCSHVKQNASASAPRRSSTEKQDVTYAEDESADDDDNVLAPRKRFKDESSPNTDKLEESLRRTNCNGVSLEDNGTDVANNRLNNKQKEGVHGKSRPGTESVVDSVSKRSPVLRSLSYPDPEFGAFDKLRDASQFAVDQIWAVYDDRDGMPRFYALIRKVCTPGFMLFFTWLEHNPINESEMSWTDAELPVACGNFRLGDSEFTEDRLLFSHVVSWRKGKKKNSYDIYPKKGEIWALFKGWNISWSLDADNHRFYEYEVVEVISDFELGIGISVTPLVRIKHSVSLFMRAMDREMTLVVIPPNEMLRFSHYIPSFRLTGNESEGIPEGSLELDCASLPSNFNEMFSFVNFDCSANRAAKIGESSGSCLKSTTDKEEPEICIIQEQGKTTTQDILFSGTNRFRNMEKNHVSESQGMNAWKHVQSEAKAPKVETSERRDSDVEINCTISDDDSSSVSSFSPMVCHYPDPEFHNFEQGKTIEAIQCGQVWAFYSDIDAYPKYYGLVKRIELKKPSVHIVWLEACPMLEEERRWFQEGMPSGCGTFKVVRQSVTYRELKTFSHPIQTNELTGKRNHYLILPRIGEIWAVYKNWSVGWSSSELENCEYDVVEICEHSDSGIKAKLLTKVNGYRSVFKPEENRKVLTSMEIPANEYIRFSHQIPAFSLTNERGGKLRGYWELDPASVPAVLLFSDHET